MYQPSDGLSQSLWLAMRGSAGVLFVSITTIPWLVAASSCDSSIALVAYCCGTGTWVATCLATSLGPEIHTRVVGDRAPFLVWGMVPHHHLPNMEPRSL